MRIRNLIWGVVSGTICSLLIVMQVLAYTYYAPITVVSASAYNMLAMIGTVNNTTLVNGGFITASGLDTDVTFGTSVPHMLATDKVLFADDLPAGTKGFKYEMGNAAESNFEIITGYNGYITTDDDAALEMGNNFSLSLSGYFDTTKVGAALCQKADAFDVVVSDTNEITAAIYDNFTNTPQQLYNYVYGFTYYPVGYGGRYGWSSTGYGSACPTDGAISKLWVDGTASKSVTLYVNDNPTALTCTTSIAGVGYDLTHTIDISAGDTLNWKTQDNAFTGRITAIFESDTADEGVYFGTPYWSTNTDTYAGLTGWNDGYDVANSYKSDQLVTGSGTITKFYVHLAVAPGAGKHWDFTILKNGVGTGITCEIADAATTGNDTAHTIGVVQGDMLSVLCDATNTPASTNIYFGTAITQSTANEYFAFNGSAPAPSAAATQYSYINCDSWGSDISFNHKVNRYIEISDFMIDSYASTPGVGKSYTFTVFINGQPTDLSTVLANNETSDDDLTHVVEARPGDTISVRCVPSGTPSGLARLAYGFTITTTGYDNTVTATVASGEHDIVVAADATNFNITVDTVEEDTVPLNSSTVPNNGNDWVWLNGNSMPYGEFIKLSVSGNQVLWYQPNDIIDQVAGDWVLHDRQVPTQDGVITWGTNPVTVTVGALVGGVVEPTNTATNITTLPPIVPPGETSPIITNPPVTSSIFNPFFDVIDDLTDHKFTPEWQGMAYATLLCAGFIIFVGSRTQSFFLTIAAGGLGLGLGYLLRFFADLWIFWVFGFLAIAALLLDARKSW